MNADEGNSPSLTSVGSNFGGIFAYGSEMTGAGISENFSGFLVCAAGLHNL